MKKVLSGVVVVLMLVGLVACGGKSGGDPVIGTWELARANFMGQEVAADDPSLGGASYTLIIKDDGTFVMETAGDAAASTGGTWEKIDDIYTLKIDESTSTTDASTGIAIDASIDLTMEMTYDESKDEITVSMLGINMIFARQ